MLISTAISAGVSVDIAVYFFEDYRTKELVKTAVVVEISTTTAVISFLKEDIGWTKRVGENACNS
jgi:hypothetical protein